jgi:hypothetical protein
MISSTKSYSSEMEKLCLKNETENFQFQFRDCAEQVRITYVQKKQLGLQYYSSLFDVKIWHLSIECHHTTSKNGPTGSKLPIYPHLYLETKSKISCL